MTNKVEKTETKEVPCSCGHTIEENINNYIFDIKKGVWECKTCGDTAVIEVNHV